MYVGEGSLVRALIMNIHWLRRVTIKNTTKGGWSVHQLVLSSQLAACQTNLWEPELNSQHMLVLYLASTYFHLQSNTATF
jgi:hypothetical protein